MAQPPENPKHMDRYTDDRGTTHAWIMGKWCVVASPNKKPDEPRPTDGDRHVR